MIFRNWVLENFPFLEDDFDALTDYELFCKMIEYMRKSLDKINEYNVILNDFKKQLDYFQNYFDNLDVQEEINNKLDEMYEDGELATLVAQFLQLQALFIYDNVEDMIASENFTNGSFAKTLHFRDNDNGGSYYKIRTITNEDVIDNITLFAITNDETLVAELIIEDSMNVKQFGFVDDSDNNSRFAKIVENINSGLIKKLDICNGDYRLNSLHLISNVDNFEIYGNGSINNYNSDSACLRIDTCENFIIRDIKITSDYQYENPTTENNALGCICIKSCNNFEIKNIKIVHANGGLFIIDSHDGDIHDNYIDDVKSWGLMLGEWGLRQFYDNYNILIHSNICKNGYDGIKLTGYIKNISIYDNLSINNSRDGIDYAGFSAEKVYIYDNKLYNNTINGIEFKQLNRTTYTPDETKTLVFKDVIIKNNDCTDNVRGVVMNIFYDDSTSNIKIDGNNFYRTATSQDSRVGIYSDCFNASTNNAVIIKNNYFGGYWATQIRVHNSIGLLIENNDFDYGCEGSNIGLIYDASVYSTYGVSMDDITIKNNKIKNTNTVRLFSLTNDANMTNVIIQNNGMVWDKSGNYPIINSYSTSAIIFLNNYDMRLYNAIPTGRSLKGVIYYSSNPITTGCIGWISSNSDPNATYLKYINIE